MSLDSTRRSFLAATPVVLTAPLIGANGAAWAAGPSQSATEKAAASSDIWPEFPRQDPALVMEVVGASHSNEAKVRELVDRHPALAKAAWDWGFGDWESALGAAAHTGQRGIAKYLIEQGARIDIFAAAMLGMTDVVKSFVAAMPGIQRTPGPHGIMLLAHAQAGGKEAVETLAYLESLGDAGTPHPSMELSDEQRQLYVGRYGFDWRGETHFLVKNNKGRLEIARDGHPSRVLRCVSGHEFFPVGAPTVRIRFKVDAGKSTAVSIFDHREVVSAVRTAE